MAIISCNSNNQSIPEEMIKPFEVGINPDRLKARLKEGGTLRFRGATHVLDGGTYNSNNYTFWACDTFELKDSKIITNGNTLVIFCNKFIADNAEILSFTAEKASALSGLNASDLGGHGGNGIPGDDGGLVSIHVIEEFQGRLIANLAGQNGGNGGSGRNGDKGSRGEKGVNGADGVVFDGFPPFPKYVCKRQGGQGGKGGMGQPGGNGGLAGDGGNGGILQIFNVGLQPIPDAAIEFSSLPGKGGVAGTPGTGGEGGDGGSGGDGNFACHGGPSGQTGDRGANGYQPENGHDGGNGQLIKENLDIEIIINK
jgi:hypothetical protein